MEEAYLNNKQRKLKRKLPRGTSEYQVHNAYQDYITYCLLFLIITYWKILLKCYCQAAWIVDDTDDEDGDSENDNQDGAGMVIDEQDHSDNGGDGSDMDVVSHFTEKFDEETIGGTEMAVSSLIPSIWYIINHLLSKNLLVGKIEKL